MVLASWTETLHLAATVRSAVASCYSTDDVGGAPGRDEQTGFILQRHLHGGDAASESGNPAGSCKFFANALAQVIGPQIDGADPAETVDYLFCRFAVELFGDTDRYGESADGVERRRDHAAVQAAMQVMTDQVGPHLEAKRRRFRVEGCNLQAEQLVEADPVLEHVAQHRFEASLFFR